MLPEPTPAPVLPVTEAAPPPAPMIVAVDGPDIALIVGALKDDFRTIWDYRMRQQGDPDTYLAALARFERLFFCLYAARFDTGVLAAICAAAVIPEVQS